MDILNVLKRLRDDMKTWVTNNINALDTKIGAISAKLSLGVHTDGLIYIFVDGKHVGVGIELPKGGDISGYVDSANNIVINNLPDGSYTVKYEMEDGSTVSIGNLVLDTNVYYSITNSLTNCTNSNGATQAVQGGSYSATITAKSGYELESVTATMGGSPVSVSGGNINIANVTGNIVITAVAEEKKAAQPVTTSITLRDGIRLGSDGSDRTGATGYCATERINLTGVPKPCTIHLTKAKWAFAKTTETGYIMTCAKNAAGANLVAAYTNESIGGGYFTVVRNNGKNIDVTITVTSNEVAEICFSGNWANSEVTAEYPSASTTMLAEATLTYTPVSGSELTNFAEYNASNTSDWSIWINNARPGSDGTYRSDTESADYGTPVVSNYIAVQNGDIVEFEGITAGSKMSVAYTSDKTVLQAAVISSMTTYVTDTSLNNAKYSGSFKINNANVGYIRLGGHTYTPTFPDIVIKIKRNGAYL